MSQDTGAFGLEPNPDLDLTTTVAEFRPGKMVGQFEILGKLGSGGMSVVYKAQDKATNRLVAVKTLQVPPDDAKLLQRFQREARAIARLEHPGIIHLYSLAVTEQGLPYIVMEFADGKTVAEVIKEDGMLPVETAKSIVSQICDALEYAHSKDVIHRDLKPGNIMLTLTSGAYQPKLVDFGIAKLNDADMTATSTGQIFGTPNYMSPEQAKGLEVTKQTDQYSLACVFFEMLTGTPPFAGTTSYSVITQHVTATAPTLSEATFGRKTFPENLEQCVAKMLSKEPAERYASLTEVKKALNAEAPRHVPSFKNPTRWSNRKYTTITGISLVVLVAALLLYFLIKQQMDPPSAPASEKGAVRSTVTVAQASLSNQDDIGASFATKRNIEHALRQGFPDHQLALTDAFFDESNTRELSKIPNVVCLKIMSGRNVDLALAAVNKRDLRAVELEHCDVTNTAIPELKNIPQLNQLYLENCSHVDDETCRMVSKLNLEGFGLNSQNNQDKKITSDGIKALTSLKTLQYLELTDQPIQNLLPKFNLSNSNKLAIRYCHLENGALDQLVCPKLEHLNLSGTTGVNFASLKRLVRFKKLTMVELPNIDLSAEQTAELARLMPHTRCYFDKSSRDTDQAINDAMQGMGEEYLKSSDPGKMEKLRFQAE
jgi:serine/threonine protein kinase